MRVFILPQDPPFGQFLDITGKDYHYLARVRRVKVGDTFAGTDGQGARWFCTVEEIESSSLRLRLEPAPRVDPPQLSIHLIQCLPKAKKMDLIIRQAAEVGLQRVIPAYSCNSQLRLNEDREVGKRLQRWQRIAAQALQQSGALRPPVIEAPRELQSVLEDLGALQEDESRLLFHQKRVGSSTLHRCLSKSAKIVTLVVGPEGGLAADELEQLRERSFTPITVGDTVLRTETAALYAIAAVQTVLYERMEWEPT
jgi:16S rRNA (uracil1498-N3)-methyltransferase